MNFQELVPALGRGSVLAVHSDEESAGDVPAEMKAQAEKSEVLASGKPPKPISHPAGMPLMTGPAQVLHELGVATTPITASPMAQVARHRAHVRCCATLRANRNRLRAGG
jgi:hypothetical protein